MTSLFSSSCSPMCIPIVSCSILQSGPPKSQVGPKTHLTVDLTIDPSVIVVIFHNLNPIGSMYGIYANIWGILMVNVTMYIAYMDPVGIQLTYHKSTICSPAVTVDPSCQHVTCWPGWEVWRSAGPCWMPAPT